MHRFFVPPEWISDGSVTLSGQVAHQVTRVLRSRPGDRIVVLDGSGWEHLVTLEDVGPKRVRGSVTETLPSEGEPRTRIALYQAMLKADRFELVLQKGTELGVASFVPVTCARSVPQRCGEARGDRWRRIIAEAAEQSGRGKVPSLEEPVSFFDACDGVAGLGLMPWEQEHGTGLKAALAHWKGRGSDALSVSVFIGPEGGVTDEEAGYARDRGIVPVSLGRRILRAETAGIVAVSAILYELGDLGG